MDTSLTKRKALERIFVFQAVEYGYLTQEQLIESIQEHEKCEPPVPLLTICKQKGYLTPSQVNHLMSKRLDASVAKAFVQGFRQDKNPEAQALSPGRPGQEEMSAVAVADPISPFKTGPIEQVLTSNERDEYERLLAEKDKLLEREQKQREFLKRKLEELTANQRNYEFEKRDLIEKKQIEIETLESELTCYKGLHEQAEQQLKQLQANLTREKQKSHSLFSLVEQGGEELRESEEQRRKAEAELEKELKEVEYIKGKLEREAKEREQLKQEYEDIQTKVKELQQLRKDYENLVDSRDEMQIQLQRVQEEKRQLEDKLLSAEAAPGAQTADEDVQRQLGEVRARLRQKEDEEKKFLEDKAKLDEKLATLEKNNEELAEKLHQETRRLKEEFERAKADMEERFHKEQISLQADLSQYRQKSENLEAKLQQYQESLRNWDEMDKLREQLKQQLESELQRRKEAERNKLELEVKLKESEERLKRIHQIYVDGELEVGTLLPGSGGESYTIKKLLGRGGMGVAYMAIRSTDSADVVVKTLQSEGMADLKVLMRFVQEARTILSFDHKNLVGGYDFQQGRDLTFFVMEFLDGDSVEDMLEEQGLLDTVEATEMVLGVAKALQYLEENNLVHRDVKPANIIYTKDQVAKLVDFGIVKMTDRTCSLTTDGIILGTPYYLSPEQTYQTNVDIRSDVYSLGATYYHMVVGEVPFPGDNPIDVIQKRLVRSPKPGKVKPDLPRQVCNIIEKMMNKNIKKRHTTAAELVSELEVVLTKIRS